MATGRQGHSGIHAGRYPHSVHTPKRSLRSQGFALNEDFLDVLRALLDEGAEFMVVGAHALAVHGIPRATGDFDVWIRARTDNAQLVWRALINFGAPLQALGVSQEDLARPGMVIQVGLPPRRIDVLTEVSGLDFDEAWETRVFREVEALSVPFIGRAALLKNKRATGRLKDLADADALEQEEE